MAGLADKAKKAVSGSTKGGKGPGKGAGSGKGKKGGKSGGSPIEKAARKISK